MLPEEIKAADPMELIEFCLEHESQLNDWERKFIDDLSAELELAADEYISLTYNQINELRHITQRISESLYC